MSELPLPLLVALVVLAIIVGLVVGARAGRHKALDQRRRKRVQGKSAAQRMGQRARELTTSGVVRLWKWNRARKKKARTESEGSDDEE